MKKYIFTALLGFLATTSIAQNNTMEIGVEGGPNMIGLRGNEALKKFHNQGLGFFGGLSFQYNLNESISLRTGVAFERKGSVMKLDGYDVNGNFMGKITSYTNLNYLTIPVLFRYSLGVGENIKVFANAGPYMGFLMADRLVMKGAGDMKISENETQFQKTDFGISAGLGVLVPIGEKYSFSFEARNNLGLMDISTGPIVNNGTIKTNALNFLVGFSYKLGKKSA